MIFMINVDLSDRLPSFESTRESKLSEMIAPLRFYSSDTLDWYPIAYSAGICFGCRIDREDYARSRWEEFSLEQVARDEVARGSAIQLDITWYPKKVSEIEVFRVACEAVKVRRSFAIE